ncbi:MAG: TAT-variant-translocated molybdopterin oxidoreductase [Silvibacterium sp.]|nr:TAT-variant-translocated molybdopterin oxidoreductase [Silvibacterium sp.]
MREQSTEHSAQGAVGDANEMQQGNQGTKLTLAQVRAKLAGQKGKRYWRSIDELAGTPEFEAAVREEFPEQASEWIDTVSRRSFLKVMGASMALAGLAGCTKQPDEPIYPYVKAPEDLILGKPVYFATAFPFATGAVPLLVKSDAYRPVKVDGNPEHPYNRGGSDPITQGTLLDLYDPDRSQRVMHRGESSTWPVFLANFRGALADKKASGGEGLAVLSSTVTSPTLARQWKAAQAAYPKAKFVQYDPVNRDSAYTASKAAFGDYVDAQYKLDAADVIVSLDADFLSGAAHPGFHRLAKDYAKKRKLEGAKSGDYGMNRLYAVECMTTTTGLKADHRLALRASDIPAFAAALAAAVGAVSAPSGYTWSSDAEAFLKFAAEDLKANGGKCVVIPGELQTPAVHLAAIAINQALGNVGKTVIYTETVNPLPSIQGDDLKSLVADMNAGKVDYLLILNANPVYSAPVDLEFEDAMGKVKSVAHLGSHYDETGRAVEWHVNSAHYLESWSDARAYDGTVSVVQPMIDPLYGGHTAHEFLQSFLDNPDISAYAAVRETWKDKTPGKASDADFGWRKVLHDGWIADTAFTSKSAGGKAQVPAPAAQVGLDTLEVVFRPDPNVYDGRYANVGWLQEIPRPVTNVSWDNAALMSYATLERLGLEEQNIVEITLNGKKVLAPAMAVPGHADGSITLHLGQGRMAGRVSGGVGFDAYQIRPSGSPLHATGATVKKMPGTWGFAVTKSHYQDHRSVAVGGDGSGTHSIEGNEAIDRGIIRWATLEEFKKEPEFAHTGEGRDVPEPTTSMFPSYLYNQNAWGMSIDMNSCVGCNACVVSCYAENNIPVVGKQQVRIGRMMQWLRIDTYYEGDLAAPRAHFQPMACQHCEHAPCEQVCPVGATVHTPEGLNMMVYNRCVGTRYCSNNCPYKVRRFNFLLYADYETESLKLMRNPDVSVRSRGVMEKCSYCVQRITAAKIQADKENRLIRDGEVVTACQQACPTDAIVFGNINDGNSRVAKLKKEERSYGVLADISTQPRTTYVAEVLNLNEELSKARGEFAS